MSGVYAVQEGSLYVLRQVRFRDELAAGREHPHDVCAVATSAVQLEEMVKPHWPDADYSALTKPLPA